LARRLDPEELRDVIAAYMAEVRAAVARYGGYLAKLMGDGVLVYFGYPQTRENDARRAIEAGLDMVASVASLTLRPGPLRARVGISTGLVIVGEVIGEGEAAERGILGEAPNLAARLQAVAAEGGVAVDAQTRALAGEQFDYNALDHVTLKGFGSDAVAFEVRGKQPADMKLRPLWMGGTPLVGRKEELEAIGRRWERARAGEGGVVVVSAEPGLGKSKLLVATVQSIGWSQDTVLWLFGASHHQSSPFHPFVELLGRLAGWVHTDTAHDRACKLAALPEVSEHLGALCAMAGLIDGQPEQPVTPHERRRLAMEAIIALLQHRVKNGPLVVVVEDAHWVDPTSADLLDRLVVWSAGRPVLILVSCRPDYRPSWNGLAHVTSLVLTRFGAPETAALVLALDPAGTLSAEVILQIVERTDGVPLFVEELTKSAVSGSQGADQQGDTAASLPPTLQATLVARLDQLDHQARELLQVAACVGREFTVDLVAAASGVGLARVEALLSDVTATGLVTRTWTSFGASFAFRHALLQDAAYGLLLRAARRRIHARIADVLLSSDHPGQSARPEIIARHLTAGARWEEAFPYWIAAGDQAIATAAHQEAIVLLRRALQALEQTPEGPDRLSRTIDVRWRLHNALYPLGRLQEALDNLLESERCAEDLGDQHRLGSVLTSQSYTRAALGDLVSAAETGERAVELSRTGSAEQHAGALLMLARTLYAAGRYEQAADRAARAVDLLGEDVEAGATVGLNTTVSSHTWLALCLAEQGRLDPAASEANLALRLARHPVCHFHETLWASVGASRERLLRGEHHAVVDLLLPLVAQCEGAFRVYLPRVASTLGAALHAIGAWPEGDYWLAQADDAASTMGFSFGHALVLALASEAHLSRGRIDVALRSAERALETARQFGEVGNEARARYALAMAHAANEDYVSANSELTAALALAEQASMSQLVAACSSALSAGAGR
jgi:class 3 adenylate cyclase/tetratricopeptide (TPR) repeat protein